MCTTRLDIVGSPWTRAVRVCQVFTTVGLERERGGGELTRTPLFSLFYKIEDGGKAWEQGCVCVCVCVWKKLEETQDEVCLCTMYNGKAQDLMYKLCALRD